MKTVEKRYFVCEACGRTSQSELKIAECQAKHRPITEDCKVENVFNKGGVLPREILVTWPDGMLAGYVLNFVREAPEKPENEKGGKQP